MAVIRGKIYLDREIVADEIVIGADWPLDTKGNWVIKNQTQTGKVTMSTLEDLRDGKTAQEVEKETA